MFMTKQNISKSNQILHPVCTLGIAVQASWVCLNYRGGVGSVFHSLFCKLPEIAGEAISDLSRHAASAHCAVFNWEKAIFYFALQYVFHPTTFCFSSRPWCNSTQFIQSNYWNTQFLHSSPSKKSRSLVLFMYFSNICSQLDFSKASNSISGHLTLIFPEFL